MDKGLPTAAEPDDLDVVLTAAISHALDDRVEAGDVAAARENADALPRHAHLPGLPYRNNACITSWFPYCESVANRQRRHTRLNLHFELRDPPCSTSPAHRAAGRPAASAAPVCAAAHGPRSAPAPRTASPMPSP